MAGSRSDPDARASPWRISTHGGLEPFWRADSKLFFCSLDGKVMAVDIAQERGAIVAGVPHELFPVRVGPVADNRRLAAPEGRKFLVAQAPGAKPAASFTMI